MTQRRAGARIKALHYLNQFFSGIGAEEAANHPIEVREGAAGPGNALNRAFGDQAEIAVTVVAGDNYFNEQSGQSTSVVLDALKRYRPEVVLAGPAFNAGRYGLACAEVCHLAQSQGIPAVTAMFPENPGTLTYRRELIIVPTTEGVAGMASAISRMTQLALKLARGQELGPAAVEGYLPRGIRKPGLREKPAADRAIDMVFRKMLGEPFETELPVELPDRIEPAPPIADLSTARIGLVTSGGLVPVGNPDRLPGGPSQVWFKYEIGHLPTLMAGEWQSVHVGFFTDHVNRNPNYVLPLNVMRALEDRRAIASIYPKYLTTSGRGTTVADARRIGKEMADELNRGDVDAVVMVAT